MTAVPFLSWGRNPGGHAELEPLFQSLRKSFVGEERAVAFSYADWKVGALGGFANGDARIQTLMQEERAMASKATD